MRLIDADKFKKFISELPNGENGYSQVYDKSSILDFIDNQPTAYDVDKVVEELDGEIFLTTDDDGNTNDFSIRVMEADEVLSIVKSGGIE